jgi:methyl-accepting chemotaxis protein
VKALRFPSVLRRNPLRTLLATLCVAFVLFSALSVALGLQLRSTAAAYDGVLNSSVRDSESILRMQVDFKTQVQEWKNTLLRGADAEQLKKYSDSFHAEEAKVQTAAQDIIDRTEDPTVKTKTEEFLASHQAMGASYQKALDFFVASKGKDVKGADAIVKGQDRAPSDLLTQLVDHSTAQTTEMTHQRDDEAHDHTNVAFMATAALLALIGLMIACVVRSFMSEIGSSIGRLRDESSQLVLSGDTLANDAEDAALQAQQVAHSAATVSGNVDSVAAAIEEMTATVQEIAQNASQADVAASVAVRQAEDTNATVARLGEASAEIGKVIAVITSIAEQTNLLALNATIEAARAGEAGKGFAVVANEVKELANQTASATEEISRKISAIQTETADAVSAIGEISTVIAQVNELQSSIAGAVEEQSATTSEIGRSVHEAATGMAEISANIGNLGSLIQNTSRSASTSRNVSNGLTAVAAELEGLVRVGSPANPRSAVEPALSVWEDPGAVRRFQAANASPDVYEDRSIKA